MVLQLGSKGKEVRILQNKLNLLKYNCGKADGIFGGKTQKAVQDFQKHYRLKVDGIFGNNTALILNQLIKALDKPKPKYEVPKIKPAPRKIDTKDVKKSDIKYIFLHHTASTSDLTWEQIDKEHKNKGWLGFGYHFYIRKDGTIIAGRGLNKESLELGSQTGGMNSISIGVCFSGNFEKEKPTDAQIKSGEILVKWLKYVVFKGNPKTLGHKEAHSIDKDATITACPGKNFPLDMFKKL